MFARSAETRLPFPDISHQPLTIQPIPPDERLLPKLECRLTNPDTGLRVPGQFTQAEATLIQTVTRNWDWQVDKNNKPACAARLLAYLEQLCHSRPDRQEVAA